MSAGLERAGPILIIGCGKMGAALVEGWIGQGLPSHDLVIVEPAAAAREPLAARGLDAVSAIGEAAGRDYRAIVLAVKPQRMAEILPEVAPLLGEAVVISIAAGVSIAGLARGLGAETAIVRMMPNTPAAIGAGASALIANARVSEGQRTLAFALAEAVGLALWLTDEEQIHAVTAMSGGGPAYVFHLIECLASAGETAGLPAETAEILARATVAGAGRLLEASDAPPARLRADVTSPGGTTEAALSLLMCENGVAPLYEAAIAKAAQRSRELDL